MKDPATADQGAVDREERVLRRGPHKDHFALLHARQEHVLLGLVEAMDLIDEQQGSLARRREPVVGLYEQLAQLLDPGGHGADLLEVAAALAGQQPGERCLAGARRPVEDHGAEPIGRQEPPQELALAQKVLLADELVERRRPHPRGQGLGGTAVFFFGSGKKRHGVQIPNLKFQIRTNFKFQIS